MGLKEIKCATADTIGKVCVNLPGLKSEHAFSVANSNRSLWSNNLVNGLTPERLAKILNDVRAGDIPDIYLEIAREIEQRDLHYRSVLSTRKHAVEGLDMFVQAANENTEDKEIAEAVEEDILKHSELMDLRKNALDALGKGFSVNEILWDIKGKRWKPQNFLFRDPRWFAYDKNSGALCLREPQGNALAPLEPYKFIVHEPNLLAGVQITSGLSFTALFYWLLKTYDVSSWAAFVDRFGYPIRIGKYGKKASEEDIKTLRHAVAAIGSDVGAVVPDSMVLDIIESKTTGVNSAVYKEMAEWVNKEISKLVLGQTASTDGTAGALGNQQGQEQVRQDICRADALQFDQTINRDIVIPYVKFNFGERDAYPRIKTKFVETKNVQLIVDSIVKLVPLGLEVDKAQVLNILGLAAPSDNDDILTPPTSNYEMPHINSSVALNNEAQNGGGDTVDTNNNAFVEITDDVAGVLERALDKSTDLNTFKKELEKLASEWQPEKIAELIAVSTFKARVQGQQDFEK
ncbi:MAG: DUF935 domain-containing protein [Spirochaetaceae bacterium]|jgi:phage gp29-like protein|nr:DUF935 domain-containing protein [Spirochaetaceae bacterium]